MWCSVLPDILSVSTLVDFAFILICQHWNFLRACVRASVRACVRVCVCACVRDVFAIYDNNI